MYYYIFFLALYISFLVIIFQKSNRLVLSFSFLYLFILSLIFGLRYDVGKDYNAYKHYFDFFHDSFTSELGYSLLNYVVYSLGLPFFVVTLFMSFATNFLIFIGVWLAGLRGAYFYLAILLYTSNLMLLSLNGMRQALAVAIVFTFTVSLFKLNIFKFFVGCMAAASFHLSAIGFFFISLLRGILIKKSTVLFLYFVMVLIFVLVFFFNFNSLLVLISSYIPFYSKYTTIFENFAPGTVGFGVTLRFLFSFVIILTYIIYSKQYNDFERLLISLFLIGVCLNLLSVTNFMWGRIGMFFYVFESLAIPYIISKIKSDLYRGVIFMSALVYSLIFICVLIFSDGSNNLIYKSVFSSI